MISLDFLLLLNEKYLLVISLNLLVIILNSMARIRGGVLPLTNEHQPVDIKQPVQILHLIPTILYLQMPYFSSRCLMARKSKYFQGVSSH